MVTDQNLPSADSGMRRAMRIMASLLGGGIASFLGWGVTILVLLALQTPSLALTLVISGTGTALAFFLAGFVARRIAGPRLWGSWIGVACAVAWYVLPAVVRLLLSGGHYEPMGNWISTGPPEITTPQSPVQHITILYDYTIPFQLALIAEAVGLAWLGDRWCAQRYKRKIDR